MTLSLHKNWLETEAAADTRMQMLRRATDRSRMTSCGQRRRSQARSGSCVCWMAMLTLLMLVPDLIVALKDVSVMIPQAVKRGSNALFTCNYDMENDTLYSVKWYKGKREFYRYTPKENPAMKVFAMTSGLNVERNLSNQSHVVLQSVPLNISGKFTCEISVEAPTFQTAMVSGEMEVVELPEEHTVVTGIQARYRIGDLVDGNCSIKYSKPAANLTWTINSIVVPPHHIKTYRIEKQENSTLESVTSAIHFMVTTQHFLKGQMRLKCTATIFDIFKEEIESIIEEDRPRIMASGRSYDINNYPLDEHGNGNGNGERDRDRERGYEDHNESYLTYYSPDNSKSGSSKAAHEIFWRSWLLQLAKALPVEHITELHMHINRQLLQWAWHCDSCTTWLSKLGGSAAEVGGGIIVAIAFRLWLWLWVSYQIIDCQYGCDKALRRQTTSSSAVGIGVDCSSDVNLANDVNVTMSKAATRGDKCFYNCQMALVTLSSCQAGNSHLKLDCSLVGEEQDDVDYGDNGDGDGDGDDNDDDVFVDADTDADAADDDAHDDADGSIASVADSGNDLTAATAKRRHQQLSAALAKVGVPAQDQRLLMTWQKLATEAVRISC